MSLSYPEPVLLTCSSTIPRLCFGCGEYHIGRGARYWWHHDSGKLVHADCYDDAVRDELHSISDVEQTTSPPDDPITVADELLPAEEPAPGIVCVRCKTTIRMGDAPLPGLCDPCAEALGRITVEVEGQEQSLGQALEDEYWAAEWERFVGDDDDDTPPAGLPRPAVD